jgi:hypothetical protein
MRLLATLSLLVLLAAPTLAQPILDGDLSDAQYTTLATKQNSNAGFGPDADVQRIVYFADDANATLYLGVVGRVPTGNDNGIGIFLGTSGGGAPTGVAAGDPLGFPNAGHYMDGEGSGNNDDFAADFEVDYMFAMNGSGGTNVFLDAASHIGDQSAAFVGQAPQDGSATASGTGAEGQTITFAFNNTGGANTGFEAAIPFSELGASAASDLQAFAFIVSATGFFSDVTVPGDVTTGNPGFNANFNTLSGGPYHNTPAVPLPVELTAFTGTLDGDRASLRWQTASETNNSGFEVQHAAPGASFRSVHFAPGAGTTLEAQRYAFTSAELIPGTHRFRLRQVDLDGSASLSPVVELTVTGAAALAVAPNPSREHTTVTLLVPSAQRVEVSAYDALGRRVATLFSGAAEGRVPMTLSGVAPGVYVLVAEGETFRTTTTATVLR